MEQFGSMPWFIFCLVSLAVWRVTHLLQAEDGPFDIFFRLRRLAGHGLWGKLLDCFYCLSVWTSAPAAWLVGRDWPERVLLWPALSGAAILLEHLNAALQARAQPTVLYSEDPLPQEGVENELLRK
jgi:hypothetical protein